MMNDSWKDLEPAPIEFLHGKAMEYFHEWRRSKVGENESDVMINGIEFSNIIARAKTETYGKYPNQNLRDAIPKSEI